MEKWERHTVPVYIGDGLMYGGSKASERYSYASFLFKEVIMGHLSPLVVKLLKDELSSVKRSLESHQNQLLDEMAELKALRAENPLAKQEKFVKEIRKWIANDRFEITQIELELRKYVEPKGE
jgi:hypothetical protein